MSEKSDFQVEGTDVRGAFLDKVKLAGEACQRGDFIHAVHLYTDAIKLDPANHILYGNRSATCIKTKDYEQALQDASKAVELQPSWPKAYYRQGVALQCLGRHADALAAFASALAHDDKSTQLLNSLTEAALKSPFQETLEPILSQLSKMRLDKSPFVVISVIGQELLASGFTKAAINCLESSLRIGSESLKLRGSVISALSSAFWKLGDAKKAVFYMEQDLDIVKQLKDQVGECRAYGNLGSAYYSQRLYKEALSYHRLQLVLAMKLKNRREAASALSALGHVYVSVGDYPNALASHKQCVILQRQLADRLGEAREVGSVGAVYLLMGDFENSLQQHQEHLKIAIELGDHIEESRAYSNLGSSYHYKRQYDDAIKHHKQVLSVGRQLKDPSIEARAYAGLGHACRCKGELGSAQHYHEQQLGLAVKTKDKTMEGRALSNLGIVCQQKADYLKALKLHKAHLAICKEMADRGGQGRAYGNLGCAYSALGRYDQATKFHKQELVISKEVHDRLSEACTHGNLAVAFQAVGNLDNALKHYQHHLNVARELNDNSIVSVALSNLGNFHSSCGDFAQAIPHYDNYLSISEQIKDKNGVCQACHNLGYAHYSLGNFRQAVEFYERNIELAKELNDQTSLSRAYCNLGLAYKALGNYDHAIECQRQFMQLSQKNNSFMGEFTACGNMGDIYTSLGSITEAVAYYTDQLSLAKKLNDQALLGNAYGALGNAHCHAGNVDDALSCHSHELEIRKAHQDLHGICRALGNLGSDYTALHQYQDAYKCYFDQLSRSNELGDCIVQAQACGNVGITKINTEEYQDALGYFEQQLATLEQVVPSSLMESGRATGNMGECYHMLGDYDEAIKCFERYLATAQQMESATDQDKAYRGLGNTHKALGNLQQALVCFEKRLVVAHEQTDARSKGLAYGELGQLHRLMGNYEQAISCCKQQLELSRQARDKLSEADAICGLGEVYQKMGEYEKALSFHEQDLRLAEEAKNTRYQARAHGNLGITHEILGNYERAVIYQEQHLSIAAQMNDPLGKTQAFSSLGRVHHALGNYQHAISYLKQGLAIAESLERTEDEAKIRHRLGLSLWANKQLENSRAELYRASELFEKLREEGIETGEYKISLYDLQSACYQALQRVLVALGQHEEALAVAERGRTRAFIDLLLERQGGTQNRNDVSSFIENQPITKDQIKDLIKKQNAYILYFSIAAGHLYSWLITPDRGVVKFHECMLQDSDHEQEFGVDMDQTSGAIFTTASTLLDHYVTHVREALGVEPHVSSATFTSKTSLHPGDSDVEEAWDMESLKSGTLSTRSYKSADEESVISGRSASTFMSMDEDSAMYPDMSSTPGVTPRSIRKMNGVRTSGKRTGWAGKPPLRALYELLIAPMEDALPRSSSLDAVGQELILVLEGDLYLVPFAVLKGSLSKECLYKRFRLIVVPSLQALAASQKAANASESSADIAPALVVGNPKVPPNNCEQWGSNPSAEHEAKIVADHFSTKPLLGHSAAKEEVMRRLPHAECIHFATHVSWKLAALILSPGPSDGRLVTGETEHEGLDFLDESSHEDSTPLSDYLLTAADILDLKLEAKLVVIGAAYNYSSRNRITSDGVIGLTRSFLSSGAQAVLVALWPVPDLACKLLLKAFYGSLLRGHKASYALCQAMYVVQSTKQFNHPSNWAGFVLVGCDVVLNNKSALMGQGLAQLLASPKYCREAIKVLLHLIDKSHQRILQGHKAAMYTAEASIDAKVKGVKGWRELLQSVGFKFQRSTNGLPDSVFFPTTDTGGRLARCSMNLRSLLGLSPTTLKTLSKLVHAPQVTLALIDVLREVLTYFSKNMNNVQVPLALHLWRTDGCHELLASVGFDLLGVGKDEVMLRSGKINSRRALQCLIQALYALSESIDGGSSSSPQDRRTRSQSTDRNSESEEHHRRRKISSESKHSDLDLTLVSRSRSEESLLDSRISPSNTRSAFGPPPSRSRSEEAIFDRHDSGFGGKSVAIVEPELRNPLRKSYENLPKNNFSDIENISQVSSTDNESVRRINGPNLATMNGPVYGSMKGPGFGSMNGPVFTPINGSVFGPINGPVNISSSKVSPTTLRHNKVAEPSAVLRESSGASLFIHKKTSSQELSDTDSYSDILGDSRIGAFRSNPTQKPQAEVATSPTSDFRHSPTSAFRTVNKIQVPHPETPKTHHSEKTPGSISSLHNLNKNDESSRISNELDRLTLGSRQLRKGGPPPDDRNRSGSDSSSSRTIKAASEDEQTIPALRPARNSLKKRDSSGSGFVSDETVELRRRYPNKNSEQTRNIPQHSTLGPSRVDDVGGVSDGEAPATQTQLNYSHLEQFHSKLQQNRRRSGPGSRKSSQPDMTSTPITKRDSQPDVTSVSLKKIPNQRDNLSGKKFVQPVSEPSLNGRKPSQDSVSSQSSQSSSIPEGIPPQLVRRTTETEVLPSPAGRRPGLGEVGGKPLPPVKPPRFMNNDDMSVNPMLVGNHVVKPVANHVTPNHLPSNHVSSNHVSSNHVSSNHVSSNHVSSNHVPNSINNITPNHVPLTQNHVPHSSKNNLNQVANHIIKTPNHVGAIANGPIKNSGDHAEHNHVTASTVLMTTPPTNDDSEEGLEMKDLKIRRRLHRDHIANLSSLQSSSC